VLAGLAATVAGLAGGTSVIEAVLVAVQCGAVATWTSTRVTATFKRWSASDRSRWLGAQHMEATTERAEPAVASAA
jgi:hypothetical protein